MLKTLLLSVFISCAIIGQVSAQQVIHEFDLKQGKPLGGSQFDFSAHANGWAAWSPSHVNDKISWPAAAAPWTEADYLIIEAENKSDFLYKFHVGFYDSAGAARFTPPIAMHRGLQPHLPAYIVCPISYLDNQHIYQPRYPRLMKGEVRGRAVKPADIVEIRIGFDAFMAPHFISKIAIKRIVLIKGEPDFTKLPPVKPIVDELGQWNIKTWPGKVNSEADLKARHATFAKSLKKFKAKKYLSKYGGDTRLTFKASGYFRTEKANGRWWFVDPEGNVFLSTGPNSISPNMHSSLQGFEELYSYIPTASSPYHSAIKEDKKHDGKLMISFLQINLQRLYGEQWYEKWQEQTLLLLRFAGFNTMANWSKPELFAKKQMPYMLPLNGFPSTATTLFRDFPDVFSDEYANGAVAFAQQLEPFKTDPWLIGYFLRNEPHWAFGDNNIALEMLRRAPGTATRQALASHLSSKYNSIAQLNMAWGTQLESFATFVTDEFPKAHLLSEKAKADLFSFSELMVDEYLKHPCNAVKKVAPNHLNLGMRYAWISNDLCYRAGNFFDVFSVNGYNNPDPPTTAEITKRTNKPVLIGEFHFGSTDRGLPANGIQGALTQADRALAYRNYIEQGFARPELIGMHYFCMYDQGIVGRFDGENYNIGILDVCNLPYPELLKAMQTSHERMYDVAKGKQAPFKHVIEKVPALF